MHFVNGEHHFCSTDALFRGNGLSYICNVFSSIGVNVELFSVSLL